MPLAHRSRYDGGALFQSEQACNDGVGRLRMEDACFAEPCVVPLIQPCVVLGIPGGSEESLGNS